MVPPGVRPRVRQAERGHPGGTRSSSPSFASRLEAGFQNLAPQKKGEIGGNELFSTLACFVKYITYILVLV